MPRWTRDCELTLHQRTSCSHLIEIHVYFSLIFCIFSQHLLHLLFYLHAIPSEPPRLTFHFVEDSRKLELETTENKTREIYIFLLNLWNKFSLLSQLMRCKLLIETLSAHRTEAQQCGGMLEVRNQQNEAKMCCASCEGFLATETANKQQKNTSNASECWISSLFIS